MNKLLEPMAGLPMQPVVLDDKGRPCFRENRVVSFLLDEASAGRKCDMNVLVEQYHRRKYLPAISPGHWTAAEMNQFYMLIGYSVKGFRELNVAFFTVGDLAELEGRELMECFKAMKRLKERAQNTDEEA